MFSITNEPVKRVITLRASGVIRLDEIKKALEDYVKATDFYDDRPHFLLAGHAREVTPAR